MAHSKCYTGRRQFECKICKQKHNRQKRADACKHKRWCQLCDELHLNLHTHMVEKHKGWPCMYCKLIYTGKDGKRKRDLCTCTSDKSVLELKQRRLQGKIASKRKMRAKRTPQETNKHRKKENERKKRKRTPWSKLKAIYPCRKCDTMFKRLYHARRCACEPVFSILQIKSIGLCLM